MSYQALLYCPDEKTARTVTQVLVELDFMVTPCTEPFAVVKKLMGEHFDAVVVDCDNEQNATLLFKSARNAANNQSALAVAVVEAQAGVAKAFRIGANLVLTKPINVEQAKGTLRVARGLLRKGEAAKSVGAAGSPAAKATEAAKPLAKAAAASSSAPAIGTTGKADVKMSAADEGSAGVSSVSVVSTSIVSTGSVAAEVVAQGSEDAGKKIFEAAAEKPTVPIAKAATQESTGTLVAAHSASLTGSGAASAPAPARDPKFTEPMLGKSALEESTASESVASESQAAGSSEEKAAASGAKVETPISNSASGATVPPAKVASSSAGSKKALLGIAAVILLAAAGYLGWTQWQQMQHSNGTTTPAVAPPAKSERIAPAPQVVPENSASIAGAPTQGATADSTEGAGDAAIASGQASHAVKPTGESQPSDTATATASAKAQAAKQPILVKNGASKSELSRAAVDSAAAVAPPSALAITPVATGGTMPKLIEGGSQPPTPVLAPVISQGVSQELLIKRTPPLYPPNALRQRLEGVVLLSATITTKGDVSSVKIIKGHELLAHAAVDAVKQWKYKPYLLNGVPVECQTEITVDFKAPR